MFLKNVKTVKNECTKKSLVAYWTDSRINHDLFKCISPSYDKITNNSNNKISYKLMIKNQLFNSSREKYVSLIALAVLRNINDWRFIPIFFCKDSNIRHHTRMLSENFATCTFNKFQFENTDLERDTDF